MKPAHCGQRIGQSQYFCTKKIGHEGMCVVKVIYLNGVEQRAEVTAPMFNKVAKSSEEVNI